MPNKGLKRIITKNLALTGTGTHHIIINLARLCGYNADEEGICFGISVMTAQAKLSGAEAFKRFNQRLALIPVLSCLFEKALIIEWNKVCDDPDRYITESNIATRMQRMLKAHKIINTGNKSFGEILFSIDEESRENIISAMIYHAIKESASPLSPAYNGFSLMQEIYKSVNDDQLENSLDNVDKIRKRIVETIIEINRKIDSCRDMAHEDSKIKFLISQRNSLEELNQLDDTDIIGLIKEIPAFLEGAFAYANSQITAPEMKEDILKESKSTGISLSNSLDKAIDTMNSTQDWRLVQHYYASDSLREKEGMQCGFRHHNTFTDEQLSELFTEYLGTMGELSGTCTIFVSSPAHQVSCGYDSNKRQFWLLDANKIPVQYFESVDEFSSAIRDCFSSNKHFTDSTPLLLEAVFPKTESQNQELMTKISSFTDGFLKKSINRRNTFMQNEEYSYVRMELFFRMHPDEEFVPRNLSGESRSLAIIATRYAHDPHLISQDESDRKAALLLEEFNRFDSEKMTIKKLPKISKMQKAEALQSIDGIFPLMKIDYNEEDYKLFESYQKHLKGLFKEAEKSHLSVAMEVFSRISVIFDPDDKELPENVACFNDFIEDNEGEQLATLLNEKASLETVMKSPVTRKMMIYCLLEKSTGLDPKSALFKENVLKLLNADHTADQNSKIDINRIIHPSNEQDEILQATIIAAIRIGQLDSVLASYVARPAIEPDEVKPYEIESTSHHSPNEMKDSMKDLDLIDRVPSENFSSDPSVVNPDQETVHFSPDPPLVNPHEPADPLSRDASPANHEESALLTPSAFSPARPEQDRVQSSNELSPVSLARETVSRPIPSPANSGFIQTAESGFASHSPRTKPDATIKNPTRTADAPPSATGTTALRLRGGLLIAAGVILTACAFAFPPSALLLGCLAGAAYLAGFVMATFAGLKDKKSQNLQVRSREEKNANDESSKLDSPKIVSNHSYLKNIFSQMNVVRPNTKTMVNDDDLNATAGSPKKETGKSRPAETGLYTHISNHEHLNDHSPSNSSSGPNHHGKRGSQG